LIDNAIHECNPPDIPIGPQKTRPVIQMFLRKLIYQDLCRSYVHQVLKLIRKLDWNCPIVIKTLEKLFTKIWKVKYSNISLMAFLCSELTPWHEHFAIFVVDYTLEELQTGLENNLFKHNQRRVAIAKYIGELYNYRMIGHQIVFDILYLLLRHGHPNGVPVPNDQNAFDAPDDFFRLRLCCTILETCGVSFSAPKIVSKFETFLVFMQVIFPKVRCIFSQRLKECQYTFNF
jgi:regulator of nonsense transcripts 2